MTHLSLITLPLRSSRWRFMTPYQLHQQLWTGFSGLKRGEDENRFLYRHDQDDQNHTILVQSSTPPDWSNLEDEAEGSTVRVRTFDPSAIRTDVPLLFMLRANPVVTRKYEDGSTRRIAVGSDRARIADRLGIALKDLPSRDALLTEWLQQRGEKSGFAIEKGEDNRILCDVGPNADLIVRKSDHQKNRRNDDNHITITTVDFSGVLRVTDSERFADTVRRGIGRGRAFGCGLISVKRI